MKLPQIDTVRDTLKVIDTEMVPLMVILLQLSMVQSYLEAIRKVVLSDVRPKQEIIIFIFFIMLHLCPNTGERGSSTYFLKKYVKFVAA